RLAVDGEIDPMFTYRVGTRLRWWLGDLDWLLIRLREPGGLARRLKAIPEFLRSAGDTAYGEMYRRDDPAPAIRECSQYLNSAFRGVVGRFRRLDGPSA